MRRLRIPSSATLPRLICALVSVVAGVGVAAAQDVVPPAYLAVVDGSVTIEREGRAQPAAPNMLFVPGDRLRTAAGRVEIFFPDGTVLDVDESSALDSQDSTLFRLTGGRVQLLVAGADFSAAAEYDIDTPSAIVRTNRSGEYRVALLGTTADATELVVSRGEASIETERGATPLRAGERSVARRDELPGLPERVNLARLDAFGQWSADQRQARVATTSVPYLPENLQIYAATLDQDGAWENMTGYGYVWHPAVAAGWRPYYNGYWAPMQQYGWTWVGSDPWSWPTHHYGRWGVADGRWFWIPGRTWASAWVSWGSAPGLVSWCPLGFDNRPVFALSLHAGTAWNGWTVVPRTTFGNRSVVSRHALHADQIARSTPFVVQRTAPVTIPHRVNADAVAPAAAQRAAAPATSQRQPSAVPPATTQSGVYRLPTGGARPDGFAVPRDERDRRSPFDLRRGVERDSGAAASSRDGGAGPAAAQSGGAASPREAGAVSPNGSRLPRAPEVAAPRYRNPSPAAAPAAAGTVPPMPAAIPRAHPSERFAAPPQIPPVPPSVGVAVPQMGRAPSVAPATARPASSIPPTAAPPPAGTTSQSGKAGPASSDGSAAASPRGGDSHGSGHSGSSAGHAQSR